MNPTQPTTFKKGAVTYLIIFVILCQNINVTNGTVESFKGNLQPQGKEFS